MHRSGTHVTLSFFRYEGGQRIWGMRQMADMRKPLARVEGLSFFKLLGTGGGSGYGFWPDFGTYALLGVWKERSHAQRFHAAHPAHDAWKSHASEIFTLHMAPLMSRGVWSGVDPFKVVEDPGEGPLAVLTRATIRPRFVLPFWRRVGGVARSLEGREGLMFTKGVGELPWVEQATFSVWRSQADMQAFAYGPGSVHLEAVQRTRLAGGFSEELYARFRVLGRDGSWKGIDPLSSIDRVTL